MASLQLGSLFSIAKTRGGPRPKACARSIAALLIPPMIAFAAGCGGSDAPQQTNGAAQAQPAAPAEAPDNPPAEENPAPVRHALQKAATATASEPPAIDPSTNPHDVFEVDAPQPTFERAQGPDGPASANTFDAAFPAKGSTSTEFRMVESPKPEPVASRDSAEETQPAKPTDKPAAKSHSSKSAKRDAADRSETDKADGESKKSLPSGFRALASFGYSQVGWPLRIRSQIDGAEMALVTGGAVVIGHDGDPPESSPQITIVLDSFYMDVAEVTLERYERYRKAINEARGPRAVLEPENAKSPPNFPVLGVLLKQAEFYAHWAHKELPTEAEWERAARGESAFAHPWGNGRAIWSQARKRDTITAVKSFGTDVSPFGIYDLAGNAREWCSDRWSPTAFADAQKSSSAPPRNWKGAKNAQPADFHVVKGNGPGWDAWYRAGLNGLQHHSDVGFRCVLRLNEKN
jgi:formylglycine-generating enzyme required for sulfatase activity